VSTELFIFVEQRHDDRYHLVAKDYSLIPYKDKPERKDVLHYVSQCNALKSILCSYGNGFINDDERFIPVDSVRGLPVSPSPGLQNFIKSLAESCVTYYALRELTTFRWSAHSVVYSALMHEKAYAEYVKTKEPKEYCQGASGHNAIVLTSSQMGRLLSGKLKRQPGKTYLADVTWTWTYDKAVEQPFFVFLRNLSDRTLDISSYHIRLTCFIR
jgi:hypothetical protein